MVCYFVYSVTNNKKPRFCSYSKKSICGENFISRTHELCLLSLLTLLTVLNLLTLLTYYYYYTHTLSYEHILYILIFIYFLAY